MNVRGIRGCMMYPVKKCFGVFLVRDDTFLQVEDLLSDDISESDNISLVTL